MARIRAASVAIAVLTAVASGGVLVQTVTAPAASAAGAHRAMVVVETGTATYHQVVTFTADSITGIQALELAGAQPVVYSFAGQGGAVCRLFGVGRDAGPNCLGGADGDNRYWAYFRAPAGTDRVHVLARRRRIDPGPRRRRRGLEVRDRGRAGVRGAAAGHHHHDHRRARDHAAAARRQRRVRVAADRGTEPARPSVPPMQPRTPRRLAAIAARAPRPPTLSAAERERRGRRAGRDRGGGQAGERVGPRLGDERPGRTTVAAAPDPS